MYRILCLKLTLVLLILSYTTGVAEAAETHKQGSVLSEGYPRLSVLEPSITGEEGSRSATWEIHFNVGGNPGQWDRILVGELMADSIKRSPISWRLTDESGDIWPPGTTSSALEAKWLSPDTFGWNIKPTDDMPFEMLSNKDFTIKLSATLDPVLDSPDGGNEGVLNGTFINCYNNHILTHYNSTYTGSQVQDASTPFERVNLFENGAEPQADDTLIPAEESMLDTYNLQALEYEHPDEFRHYALAPDAAAPSADDNEYRDLYIEDDYNMPANFSDAVDYGSEADYGLKAEDYDYVLEATDYDFAPVFDPNDIRVWEASENTDISGQTHDIYNEGEGGLTDYDSSFEFNSSIEYPMFIDIGESAQMFNRNAEQPEQTLPRNYDLPEENIDNMDIIYDSAFNYTQYDVMQPTAIPAAPPLPDDLASPPLPEDPAEPPFTDTPFSPPLSEAQFTPPLPDSFTSALYPDLQVVQSVNVNDQAVPVYDANITDDHLYLYNSQPDIDTSLPSVPKTRSSAPTVVSYNNAADDKSNPTTKEISIKRDIFLYLFICVSISLFLTQNKQKR